MTMLRNLFTAALLIIPQLSFSQKVSAELFAGDPVFHNASVSLCFTDAENGEVIIFYDPERSLKPASVMKILTSAVSLEILGPDYKFSTLTGYTGTFNRRTGNLKGDIIIQGGGDPVLGSDRFPEYYSGFPDTLAEAIKAYGIRKIKGQVITDDSRYDYQPVPYKWLAEDIGNYYGAGAFGLSVSDNTYNIHLHTNSGQSRPEVTSIEPEECTVEITNFLSTGGVKEDGKVFSSPYSRSAFLSGTIPENQSDIILKASMPDPPFTMAQMLTHKLRENGIKVSGEPFTARLITRHKPYTLTPVINILSPPLSEIIRVMNHESVNMYAEHLLKELGKVVSDSGTSSAGIKVVKEFLDGIGINTEGIYIADGSGLSPTNALNSDIVTDLLYFMRSDAKYYSEFFNSLPLAGKEGTLKKYFTGPVSGSGLRAKSGSMTGVRSYAGYFTAMSGKEMIFCIIINNFSAPHSEIIGRIEEFLKEIILYY